MTCKDCIHYEVCIDCNGYDDFTGQPVTFDDLKERNLESEECDGFIDKLNYQKVVQCKDCIHATFYSCRNDFRGTLMRCKYDICPDGNENFYCSYGGLRGDK